MQCQTEGCYNTAIYGAQIISASGYRIGLCVDCAKRELREQTAYGDLPMEPPYLIPIEECEWWPEFNITVGKKTKSLLKK